MQPTSIIGTLIANPEDYMLPCLTKKFFGIECFGCGLQRAIALIFQGEFIGAFQMYPAVYSLLALFIFMITRNFISFRNDSKLLYILVAVNLTLIVGNYFYKQGII